jgi:ABC-type transporter Mla MlaB component
MIRITPIQKDTTVAQLRVEGRVTQQTIDELSGEGEAVFAEHRSLLLELSGVQFVDPAGIAVFRCLIQKGVVLTACSGVPYRTAVGKGCE